MFNKCVVVGVLLWLILVSGYFAFLYTSTAKSTTAYRQLMDDFSPAKGASKEEEDRPIQQARTLVSKQIFYQKGPDRLQSRLISDSSELIYSKKKGELVEHFKDVDCMMQEKGEPGSNLVRRFRAQDAIYSYQTGVLEAKEVEVAHYLMPGKSWPASWDSLSPLFEGKAKTVHLSLIKEPDVKAQGFQAIFYRLEDE